jgi:uncharacterized membrane protein YbhN (UPF0104 family)
VNARALGRHDRLDDVHARHDAATRSSWSERQWWPWARRVVTLGFVAVVGALLWRYAEHVKWQEVWSSLMALPKSALLAALALAGTSHLLYSCFDLLGRRYTGHSLRARTVMAISFISYAFNLTIGSLAGGVGFRYRLYSQAGLSNGVITRIVSMSMLTNWLGYKLLAGLLFIFHPLQLPPAWHMGSHGLQWAGLLLVAISGGYLLCCVRMGERRWEVRGHELYLPPWRMALLQMAVSCANWMLMAGIVYVLLQQQVDYTDVLTVLLVGAIAGVFAHVPGGLGVFEFVFVALLSHRVPQTQLLAALLGYRAIYYIVPTLVAGAMYAGFELQAKRTSAIAARAG